MGDFSLDLYLTRLKRRESLKTVSTAIGCSATYLSELENRKRPKESEVLERLYKYYGAGESDDNTSIKSSH